MTKVRKEQDVIIAIKSALANLKILMRAEIKKHWKTMERKQRYAAGRTLVYMNDVVNNPELFFSRAGTERDWAKRAYNFAYEKDLDDVNDAYYIVQDPKWIVLDKLSDILYTFEMDQYTYRLFDAIQSWEYRRTAQDKTYAHLAHNDANTIIKLSRQLDSLVKIEQSCPTVKPFRQFVYNIQYQR